MVAVTDMYRGSMVALLTPMSPDGGVDYGALSQLVEFHLSSGTDVLVPAGTTGESATLNFDEHCEVIRSVVDKVKGRVPVIAGTGANSTSEALALTQHAERNGADACLLITPYYNKPPQEGLYRHYKTIAEAVSIPHILYNVPGRTACDMLPETVRRLSEIENIIGIKEASEDTVGRCAEIRRLCGDDFQIYSGEDDVAAEVMLNGGNGVISVTANVAPEKMHKMSAAALAGDREQAMQINQELAGLHKALFIESNPIPSKWALHEMGMIPRGIRLPLVELDGSKHEAVRAAMRQAGVI